MKNLLFFALLALALGLTSCKDDSKTNSTETSEKRSNTNLVLYHGGDIITMDGEELELAEAVVAQNEEIVFVGNKAEALKQFPDAEQHDLTGNVLMPGLVEPHVHPSLAATMLTN